MTYKEIDKENQSSLKKILESPKAYLKSKEPRDELNIPEHFIFGDIVDMMIAKERDAFYEKYFIVKDEVKCSDSIKVIIEEFVERVPRKVDLVSHSARGLLLELAKKHKYGLSWKEDTIINKLETQGKPYYDFLLSTKGKIPLPESEYSKAIIGHASLMASEFTSPYMNRKKNEEFFDKLVVEWEWEGVKMKGELDRVIINHEKKTIQPIDFKTTSRSNYGFQYDFWKFRYDFQAATYSYGLKHQPDIISLMNKGYRLLPFLYIVIEKESMNPPFVFEVPEKVIEIGMFGGTRSNGRKMEGFSHAIRRLKFHKEHGNWDYSMEHLTNGKIVIEV